MVSPSEGNEARRDGRQGVAVPHSSVEAGERPSRTPWERRGCRVVDGELEPRRGYRASPACHRETTPSCGGQRFHNVTNRGHLPCTPGSVGDPGSNPWSDPAQGTRAFADVSAVIFPSEYSRRHHARLLGLDGP